MRLKLFENYEADAFEAELGLDKVYVGLSNRPIEYKGSFVMGGKTKWTLDIQEKRWGYDLGSARLISLYLIMEVEDATTGDPIEKEIEVDKNHLGWEQFTQEIKGFPLSLTDIEIDMRNTIEQEYWRYKLIIGYD